MHDILCILELPAVLLPFQLLQKRWVLAWYSALESVSLGISAQCVDGALAAIVEEPHHALDASVDGSVQVIEPDPALAKSSMYEDKATHKLERKTRYNLVKVVDLFWPIISAALQLSSRPRVIPNRIQCCTVARKAQLVSGFAVWLDLIVVLIAD
jgi:hypothetical protein